MKNKKQLVLSITLVLTLVLVIAGATFAFFSATGNSTDNAVRAGATNLAGTISITTTTKKAATNLIPVASQDTNFQRYPKREGHICEDDLGNEICSLYEFTITNTANVSQEVYVSFKPTTNGYDNLYFATFNTTATSATYSVATAYTNGSLTAVSASDNSTIGHPATKLTKNNTNEIAMPGLTTTIPSSGSVTYTVLVWLQDTGSDQNTEQGSSFAAGINVTTGSGEGVTGILSGGSNQEEEGNWVYTTLYSSGSIGEPLTELTEYSDVYYTEESAASAGTEAFGIPIYLRYKIVDDNITESYVVFVVTDELVQDNPGMTAGTYYLKGYDEDKFLDNAKIIYNAYGGIGCKSDDIDIAPPYNQSYTPTASINFYCELNSLNVSASANGSVSAYYADMHSLCEVNNNGSFDCDGW